MIFIKMIQKTYLRQSISTVFFKEKLIIVPLLLEDYNLCKHD